MDEKWSFVAKKQKNLDERELEQEKRGDCWDFVAFDPQHRLVLGVLVGKRHSTLAYRLLRGVKRQLDGRVPELIVTDAYGAYGLAIRLCWRKSQWDQTLPRRLCHAVLSKQIENSRLVKLEQKVMLGEREQVRRMLGGKSISTSLLERYNGTDRHRNSRKARKTYRFSKDWETHEAVSYFTIYSYNFCWCVRTLREKQGKKWITRTPAMSAGLADHVWSLSEWLSRPGIGPAS